MIKDPKAFAKRFFNADLPVTQAELKAAFRRAAKLLHSDVSGGDTDDLFIAMKAAYDELCALPGTFSDGAELESTEEGTPLTDLGHGVGPTKNGKDCTECDGKGYHTEKNVRRVVWTPRHKGVRTQPCERCRAITWTIGCRTCDGLFDRAVVTTQVHKICVPCQGKGEIEIFNPVIPKGLLANLRSK